MVLVTVALVTVVAVVLVVALAGFTVGLAVSPAPGSVAGSPAAAPPSPGTSRVSVSTARIVAPSGSITTCVATDPSASTAPPAPKAPPAGATKRAATSDPRSQATPPSAPDAFSRDASTVSSPAQQTHTIGAHARPGARARGDNAPTAANGKTVRDHPGHPRIRDAGAVGPRVNLAAVHRERARHVDPALRARGHQRPGAAERQIAPHLHAAARDVHVGRARLDNSVLPGQRHRQVAVGADGLARVAVKLQVAGFGPGPTGARRARLVVRGARNEKAVRARGIRRPAQQNA